ncbi:hypothetical protein T484DRAFT_1888147 [Baffinella frigidus]|nr:hypothetical protein T484DRAFT_1888147 [Cryptophyta sp. CCMP2293]
MPLSPSQAHSTLRILEPKAWQLSPVAGLFTRGSPVLMSNLHRCKIADGLGVGLGATCALSREVFSQNERGGQMRATRLRSQAASWLTPEAMGHVVGLALSGASRKDVKARLSRLGYSTNRTSGVSFARYERLVDLVREAGLGVGWGLPLLLCWVWERAERKRCLLDFLLAVDAHRPILREEYAALRSDAGLQHAWSCLSFGEDATAQPQLAAAADTVLHAAGAGAAGAWEGGAAAASVELLAASLQVTKPPIEVRYHSGRAGGAPRPDCVEAALRELIDLLLYDPAARRFDLTRLPRNASGELRRFYETSDSSDA